jgi:hypothetical protein
MKYCPNCRAEYRTDIDRCYECDVALVDTLPEPAPSAPDPEPTMNELTEVFITGRRMDAELVRSRLESDGMEAKIWSAGMGSWRLESGLTELTGVPSAFNSHRVMVAAADERRARDILSAFEEPTPAESPPETDDDKYRPVGFMAALRSRWLLLGAVLFLLLLVLLFGPPGLS